MKIIHICGPSAVGKNYLIQKLKVATEQDLMNRTNEQKYLLERFGVTGKVAFPERICPDKEGSLDRLKDDLREIVTQNECDTIIHRWQYQAATVTQFMRSDYPSIEQKTFLIWLNSEEHLRNARLNRKEDFITNLDETRVRSNFVDSYRRVLFHASMDKRIRDKKDYPEYRETVNLTTSVETLSNFGIEVVTPISPHFYANVDSITLRTILSKSF